MTGLRRITEIRWAEWQTEALRSALRLGVFTALGEKPLTAAELADRLGLAATPAVVTHYFDALAELGLLDRDEDRYANGEEAATFLDAGRPTTYVGDVVEHRLGVLDLARTLQAAPGQGAADRFYDSLSPHDMRGFFRLMSASSTDVGDALAERLQWTERTALADIGCAEGAVAARILNAHPHLRAVGFDLPAAKTSFEEHMAAQGMQERAAFRPGDFFQDPLPAADVLLFVRVLHNWDLDHRRTLLRRAYEALPPGGLVVVCESMLGSGTVNAHFESLLMNLEVGGGSEFAAAECVQWMAEAGFRTNRTQHLTGTWSMVTGVR